MFILKEKVLSIPGDINNCDQSMITFINTQINKIGTLTFFFFTFLGKLRKDKDINQLR